MMDEITTNKDKRMQLRKLPSAPIRYFNPEEKCFLLLGISESTKYLLLLSNKLYWIDDVCRNDANNGAL